MPGAMVLLQPGEGFQDAASPPSGADIIARGDRGICRYGSIPRNNWKNIKYPQEIIDYAFHRVCLVMNGEQSETTWMSGYSSANLGLAKAVRDICIEIGYPDEAPIPFSIDTDARPGDQRVWGAFKAYKDTVPNPLWCYGGSQLIEWLIDEGLCVGGWIASALWWSRTPDPVDGVNVFAYRSGLTKFNYYLTPLANFRQFNSIPYAGTRIDPNTVMRTTAVWDPGATPTPIPPPNPIPIPPIDPEQEMSIYRYVPELGWVAEISMGRKVWVTGDYFYGVVQGQLRGSGTPSPLGIYAEPAPLNLIQALPDFAPDTSGTPGAPIKGVRITTVPGDALIIT